MMQVVAKLTEENMNLQNELNKVQKDFERCRSQVRLSEFFSTLEIILTRVLLWLVQATDNSLVSVNQ